jgi:chemosensory pili system protein ChpA (sensor histidine kinase/response regulator)
MPRGGRRSGDREGRDPLVLIADSYESARRPCARYLDHFHFLTKEAGDRDQALATIAEAIPAVILIETDLPDLSPWRLSGYLNAHGRTRVIPIIVMVSTGGRPSYSSGGFRPAAVLVKPFSLTEMLQHIRRALHASGRDGRQRQRSARSSQPAVDD